MPTTSNYDPAEGQAALEYLLSHEYSHFRKVGNDDYRDPSEKNPGFSLSSKGWSNHKNAEWGDIFSLARKHGWKGDADQHSTKSKPTPNPSRKISSKTSSSANAAVNLWKKEQTEGSRDLAFVYLEENRKIPEDHFADLFDLGLLKCVLKGKEEYEFLCPMLTPAQVNQVAVGQDLGDVHKVHRVIIKLNGFSVGSWVKKQLGSPDDGLGRLSYLPPLSANAESLEYLVIEGLEDALTLRPRTPDYHVLVCQSKSNLQHVPEFLPRGAKVLIFSDHDGHANPNENGEHAAAKLRQQLRDLGYGCDAFWPAKPKEDANDALKEDRLDQWHADLIQVPEIDADQVLPETDFDIDAIVGDALPEIPRGILPKELETYLELVAEQLDLNYEAAFCELLVNISIAIGGRKQIHVHQSDHGWKEKACLWLASIGISGSGKTPLNRKCGGALLAHQQRHWQDLWEQEVEDWERMEDPKPAKPTRKRWIANTLTMERLVALHAENPAGIGFVSDEILGILNGLGQFKGGRGNDKQIILSLWNGYDFENPTADADRYVRDVYVPMSGGIQEVLVRKIINDANTSDGLAARFLFNHIVIAQTPASIERLQEIDQILFEDHRGYDTMKGIFDRLVAVRDVEQQVLMDMHARNHLALFAQHLKTQARKGSEQGFAAYMKLQTYLYRLTLLLHYMTRRNADDAKVSEQTAQHAISIMRFFIASMRRAYGTVEMTDRERKARAILDKLHQLGGRARHDEVRQPLKKTVSSREATEIFKELIQREVLREVVEGKSKFLELVKK